MASEAGPVRLEGLSPNSEWRKLVCDARQKLYKESDNLAKANSPLTSAVPARPKALSGVPRRFTELHGEPKVQQAVSPVLKARREISQDSEWVVLKPSGSGASLEGL